LNAIPETLQQIERSSRGIEEPFSLLGSLAHHVYQCQKELSQANCPLGCIIDKCFPLPLAALSFGGRGVEFRTIGLFHLVKHYAAH
jgi:hypothetical protein